MLHNFNTPPLVIFSLIIQHASQKLINLTSTFILICIFSILCSSVPATTPSPPSQMSFFPFRYLPLYVLRSSIEIKNRNFDAHSSHLYSAFIPDSTRKLLNLLFLITNFVYHQIAARDEIIKIASFEAFLGNEKVSDSNFRSNILFYVFFLSLPAVECFFHFFLNPWEHCTQRQIFSGSSLGNKLCFFLTLCFSVSSCLPREFREGFNNSL